MRPAAAALLLLLGACQREAPAPAKVEGGGGEALETAAKARGLIDDPGKIVPTGVYANGEDRVCVLPLADGSYRIGASVDLGEEQRCTARGSAKGRDRLEVRIGGECRFVAEVDGDRIVFPATMDPACDRQCHGRSTLAALSAGRLSDSAAEAARTEGLDGEPLCGG